MIKALLLAYGSAAVQLAFEGSETVAQQVTKAAHDLYSANLLLTKAQTLEAAGRSAAHLQPLPAYHELLGKLHALRAEAFTVDQKLFDAINRELAWAPQRPARLPRRRLLRQARTIGPGAASAKDQQATTG